ncbi:MAG: hypothetical protein HKN20_01195 [Gemmatimonadetes bacterium]|nr:hypothetical protein [Gemmatimonadota bacterium]
MCTATWFLRKNGYEFFFNRDERKSRLPAAAPAVREARDGVRFIAPADGDHGGSWIAANEHGLSIGLLNRYEVPFDRTRTYRSRGLLVLDLASSRSGDEIARRLAAARADRYPPFRVIVLAPGEGARVFAWDGSRIAEEAAAQPVVSSSHAGLARVTTTRTDAFAPIASGARYESTRAAHLRFHHDHGEGPSAYSVCMHRDDAETRNFTHVIVSADTVTLRQKPDAPCRSDYLADMILKRV